MSSFKNEIVFIMVFSLSLLGRTSIFMCYLIPNFCDRFLVRVSYLEIYNEEVRDLLRSDQSARLEVKERRDVGVYVKDLITHVVHNADEMDKIMTLGNKNSMFQNL